MNFKNWLEQLELVQTIPGDERTKYIYAPQPNNKEQEAYWKKQTTHKMYKFPIKNDKFIHFTLPEAAAQIVNENRINTSGVFAVSTSFGIWLPSVQFNHVIGKKKQKFLWPNQLRDKLKSKKMLERGWEIPNFGQEIAAVIFQTDIIPKWASLEEVYWDQPITISNAQLIPSREAIRRLKNTPHGKSLDSNSFINYY